MITDVVIYKETLKIDLTPMEVDGSPGFRLSWSANVAGGQMVGSVAAIQDGVPWKDIIQRLVMQMMAAGDWVYSPEYITHWNKALAILNETVPQDAS